MAEPTRGAAKSQRSEVVFNSTRDLLPSSDSLDYVNRWRSPHAEPPSHSDRKSSDSLDYANRWRSPHAEPPSHSDRKSCSTRREISSAGRGYGCPNIVDIVTPSAKEMSITFRTGIRIAHVTTIRNRHSETVDKAPVSRNSIPGAKFPLERVYYSDSLDYANRWRSPHAEPPSHSYRKSCSTRRDISSAAVSICDRIDSLRPRSRRGIWAPDWKSPNATIFRPGRSADSELGTHGRFRPPGE
ncbi:hypothetical protein Taro_055472 [Colocasia esculenta]|uniref:Uncharacterized protein n=1 Tax=Colocasia esculenta TaxID=4460 RepID=A0A843XR29_COLES|nr:hypothetical protein [Colocasia esculenta]